VPSCHGFELLLEHALRAKSGPRTAAGARSLRTTTGTSVRWHPSQEACLSRTGATTAPGRGAPEKSAPHWTERSRDRNTYPSPRNRGCFGTQAHGGVPAPSSLQYDGKPEGSVV
jgi:hypothetical protein